MRVRDALAGSMIVLGLTLALPATAANEPGRVRVRGWLGFAVMTLDDVNDRIRSERDAFRADSLVDETRWDPFGGTPNLGIELETQVSPLFSVGIGFNSQRSALRHEAFRTFSSDPITGDPLEFEEYDEDLRLRAWDVVGTLGLWVPSAPGLHFGAQLGLVRGTFESDRVHVFSSYSAGEFTATTHGIYSGSGVVVGGFTGYEQPLSPVLSFSSRLGYRYRRISAPFGIFRTLTLDEHEGTSYEWENGPLLDATGRRMSLDLGGFYFQMMFSMGLGGGS